MKIAQNKHTHVGETRFECVQPKSILFLQCKSDTLFFQCIQGVQTVIHHIRGHRNRGNTSAYLGKSQLSKGF